MKCTALEPRIALYVEGDLRRAEAFQIEAHLAACASCRELAEDLSSSQGLFKELRQNMPTSAELAEVRQKVFDEVGDLEPVPAWVVAMHRLVFAGLRRKPAIAGVVLTGMIAAGLWYARPSSVVQLAPQAPEQIAAVETAQPEAVPEPVVIPQAVQKAPARRISTVQPRPSAAERAATVEDPEPQLAMKFLTDDPDIIIYWLPRDKGD